MEQVKAFKNKLEDKIDKFIYTNLSKNSYDINIIPSKDLLTYDRLDLAFKISFLELKEKNKNLAEEIYRFDIASQTNNTFSEKGNINKNCFNEYIKEFNKISRAFKSSEFNPKKSLIPLSSNGKIINGSHRTAALIYHNKDIHTITTEENDMILDYNHYYRKNVPTRITEIAVKTFIRYKPDVYLAFLWPSSSEHYSKIKKEFSKIVYEKELSLVLNGGINLLIELYKHMPWIGDSTNNFKTSKQKYIECFKNKKSFKVIAFQSENLQNVIKIKEKVRNICKIGFSSIHITDNHEEAVRLSKILFNENGINFLNNAKIYKFSDTINTLEKFKENLNRNNLNAKDIIIDSGLVLQTYGIRKAGDIDYLVEKKYSNKISGEYDDHLKALIFHKKKLDELLYNPKYYFEFLGLKFISIKQVYKMKQNRLKSIFIDQDALDLKLISPLISDNKINKLIATSTQFCFFYSIIIKNNIRKLFFKTLKVLKIYNFSKRVYLSILKK